VRIKEINSQDMRREEKMFINMRREPSMRGD